MAQDKLQKLELTWIGKDEKREAIEPRILIEDPKYSYGDTESGNMLIHGDNLLALKALERKYTNRIKCIYIDPPYNTGNAFEYYDDGVEHSIWLSLMFQRISILYNLLAPDGAFCMQLDDEEVHYAKIICDEIFKRNNFIATIAVKSSTPSGVKTAHRTKKIIKQKDFILVYKKSDALTINPLYVKRETWDTHYSLYLTKTDERYNLQDLGHVLYEKGIYDYVPKIKELDINDKKFKNFYINHRNAICRLQTHKNVEAGKYSKEHMNEVVSYRSKDDNKDDLYYNGSVITPLSRGFQKVIWNRDITEDLGMLLCDFWSDIDFQNTQNEGSVDFPTSKKPEALIYRIISMFTEEGDYVLDSFLGSGTTAAVAQKMNRRYIGIELGQHAYTHCFPRLVKVTSGTDQSGMTKSAHWKGGSGFKFYELAPSLLKEDKFGNLVINKEYNADMLAAAMAKQEGYTYQPDSTLYWKQGQSSEHDYIYTTTQLLTVESLDAISETMQEDESLLICCTAFQKECFNHATRITVKKIPQMLLGRCEFNKDDYSLNIIDMPHLDLEDAPDDDFIDEEPEAEDNKPVQGTFF